MNKYRADHPISEELTIDERAKLKELEKEVRALRMERAFLKNSIVGGRLWSREKGARPVESALG